MTQVELTGLSWIGSEPASSEGATFFSLDPLSGERLPVDFTESNASDVDAALGKAASAFTTFRQVPSKQRAKFLRRIAEEIEALGDQLLERAHSETALPMARLSGERGRTCAQLRMFADLIEEGSYVGARIDHGDASRSPIPKPDTRSMGIALGPVVVFGASNFPLAFSVAGGDTASVLAAGCPVVCKAHPKHPGCSELAARAILAAAAALDMPDGVFSLIQGESTEVGAALVRHPACKAVAFTGSLRGGRALFDIAADRSEPVPVFAEMGSTNPVFLLPEALRANGAVLAERFAQSVTMGCGQFCTNPGLLLAVGSDATEAFAKQLGEQLTSQEPVAMLHAGIRAAYAEGARTWAQLSGVEQVGQLTDAGPGSCHAQPLLFRVSAELFMANAPLQEELFGPATLLVKCKDSDQMLEVARGLRGQLTATLEGTDEELVSATDLRHALEERVGRLLFGGAPTGVEVCASMVHGGPYPATSDARTSSVGTLAMDRFLRPICYQDTPESVLPLALQDTNPLGILRLVDGEFRR